MAWRVLLRLSRPIGALRGGLRPLNLPRQGELCQHKALAGAGFGDRQGGGCRRWMLAGLLGLLGLDNKKEEEEEEEDQEEMLLTAVKRGILAIQEGDLETGEMKLHIALKMAQDLAHEAAITQIFCLLANLNLERGFLEQAERLFKTVLQRLLASGEEEDANSVVEISVKLAKRGDDDEDTLGLAGLVFDLWAQFLVSGGRLAEAEEVWREAVGVSRRLYGEEDDQSLVVKNSLATVLTMRGQLQAAADLLASVVEVARRKESDNLTAFLVNLGMVRLKQGLEEAARASCSEAVHHAEAIEDSEAKIEASTEANACLDLVEKVLKGAAKETV